MSYGASAALQAAIFQRLSADPAVSALTGGAVYDAVPSGQIPPLYVSLGPEDVRDRSDQTGAGALHDFTVSVVSDTAGFSAAKEVAAAVSDALVGAAPPLARGRIVSLTFRGARARRVGRGTRRRIDLRFLARVADA
jgi:hypothetical protein